MKDRPLAWFAAILILFLFWSNSFHAIGWLRRTVSAWDLITLRFAPVGLFCLIWAGLSRPSENLRILRAHPLRLVLMGLLMVPIYNLCLNWGQGLVAAGTAALLIATNPILTYGIALLIRQERFQARKAIGLAVAFTGVFLLLRSQGRDLGASYTTHALVTLLAPLSWAVATLLGRPLVQRESPVRVTYISLGIGSLPFLFAPLFQSSVRAEFLAFAVADHVAWIHLWLLCTIVGFAIWYAALRHLPASSVAAFVLLNPPLAVAFGPIWGTDRLHATVLGFGAMILGGIAVSVWPGGALTPPKKGG
ncbi:MAG: DMT family transporter [Candidatus Eisenbacteria bacterium]|nr:DMT family transporter [Candidatus Eisenbacteria bacterium]MCC7143804.1 DMT family transporter [Candidatus Eisenbacteria bacterium]